MKLGGFEYVTNQVKKVKDQPQVQTRLVEQHES